jgi:hypothetical protein
MVIDADRFVARKSLIEGIFIAIRRAGSRISVAAVNRRVVGSNPT